MLARPRSRGHDEACPFLPSCVARVAETPSPLSPQHTPPSTRRCCAARRIEKALRRFRKSTNMVGHLRILRNRKQFESNHDKKIRKTKESAMRQARARRSARNRF